VESGPVCFSGGEITVITALLVALAGAISALWFAYSKMMSAQIERLTEEAAQYRATMREALGREREA
jgi:hypothetical protein